MGVELVVLRPGIVFGPRDVWITDIARAIADGSAALVDGGPGYCNSIYVDNLVHAVRCALTSDTDGEVFLVGDEDVVTWRALYERVADLLGFSGNIPAVAAPPVRPPPFDLLEAIRSIPHAQRLIDRIPRKAKAWGRHQIEAATRARRAIRDAYGEPEDRRWRTRLKAAPPQPSLEMALLHCCRHRFSYDRARTRLGFVPPVSLTDGLVRTAGWLQFIGYAVHLPPAVTLSR